MIGLLIFLNLGDFVTFATGVVYPSIATYQLLNPLVRGLSPNEELQHHWYRYWSIYALVNSADVILSKFCDFIPMYQFCKVFLLLGVAYPGKIQKF